jgi:hypothetical protein
MQFLLTRDWAVGSAGGTRHCLAVDYAAHSSTPRRGGAHCHAGLVPRPGAAAMVCASRFLKAGPPRRRHGWR